MYCIMNVHYADIFFHSGRLETKQIYNASFFYLKFCRQGETETMFPGTWFLASIDEMHRRKYDRTPTTLSKAGFYI